MKHVSSAFHNNNIFMVGTPGCGCTIARGMPGQSCQANQTEFLAPCIDNDNICLIIVITLVTQVS
jgi:hypothetical protein